MRFAKKFFNKIKNSFCRDINAKLDTLQLLYGRHFSYHNKYLIDSKNSVREYLDKSCVIPLQYNLALKQFLNTYVL